ncbi:MULTISPECIES: AGE family epimerase/isomerase [unclassified Dysgonomonas]|jgi:mannobiose 2-epimerase|uniref:AGE family epimerase/isomerase n=1 Tax=unclassified Dysgonomonas TaxID=2630389 RepID=UPI0025BC0621|nr:MULTISPECIES: AGE family epimerase/isomerase [unclassified Dysgonomonas]MDR2002003.1 AGE family epimerase/isomerase [Prevotella sp.]HMM02788.1 AGE family epimerase/isomerase [Dysgonomonas sp.]
MNGFRKELTGNILPFWINKMQDDHNGGFYGQIDGNNILNPQAGKGAILNARILWTFSSAYRILKNEEYLKMAQRAFDYIVTYFIDKESGGAFWELGYKGNPVNTKKQTYVQGFMLYGFSEYFRATGEQKALELAKDFFYLIEKYKDKETGGYLEAFTRDWQPIEDMRLSDKDDNEVKTMNTHLHILEPYTNLCRIWKDPQLESAQRQLIDLFTDKILDSNTNHLNLFFDEDWNVKSNAVSYGHDIEASWLLFEAAEVLGDKALITEIKNLSLKIADAASEGIDADGSMIYEYKNRHMDTERHWWVQAEAVVGYMYAYRNSKNAVYKERASQVWSYIQDRMVDNENGEWYWSRLPDGSINRKDDKAGFWKCPYHNGRMCMEMIEHFGMNME